MFCNRVNGKCQMKGISMHRFTFLIHSMFLLSAVSPSAAADKSYKIYSDRDQIHIVAGNLKRTINIKGRNVYTTSIAVAGEKILAGAANELSFCIEKAVPNRCPVGLNPKTGGSVTQKTTMSDSTDALSIKKESGRFRFNKWEAENHTAEIWPGNTGSKEKIE